MSETWVDAEGPVPAMVMFVGEAPAAEELKLGKPFVGKAGKILDKMLAKIDLPREMVYITNYSKKRLPSNKFISPEDNEMWKGILRAEIGEVNPSVIVSLGAISTEYFLGPCYMGRVNAIPHNWRGKLVIPSVHPAAILYRPESEKQVVEAFRMVKKAMCGEVKKLREMGLYTATLLVTRLFPGSTPEVIRVKVKQKYMDVRIGAIKTKSERKEKGGQDDG